jgi:hypothetical protein
MLLLRIRWLFTSVLGMLFIGNRLFLLCAIMLVRVFKRRKPAFNRLPLACPPVTSLIDWLITFYRLRFEFPSRELKAWLSKSRESQNDLRDRVRQRRHLRLHPPREFLFLCLVPVPSTIVSSDPNTSVRRLRTYPFSCPHNTKNFDRAPLFYPINFRLLCSCIRVKDINER